MTDMIFASKPYTELYSFRRAEMVFLATFTFVERFLSAGDRTCDQMIQAARSGKQNIAEGAMASAGSKHSELFLTNVALASLAELHEDYLDYLKTRKLRIWSKDSREALFVRDLCRRENASYDLYRNFIETRSDEVVANIIITLICQTKTLLQRQIAALEKKFLKEGGVKEQMFARRMAERNKNQ